MVAHVLRPPGLSPYGAQELKDVARSYMVRAVMAGSTVWVVFFLLALGASVLFLRRPVEVKVSPIDIVPISPPIIVEKPWIPPAPIARPNAPTKAGDIVPAAEETEAAWEENVEAPSEREGPPSATSAGSERIDVAPSAENGEPPPDWWVYVEELPEAITRVEPEYPEIAREAGVSGTVYVRALVGKDGHVRDALVEPKHSIPMLDEAALTAARRWVFKPAFNNNKPVPVWVVIPMKFSLHY